MGSLVAYVFLAYVLTRIALAHFPRRAIALLAGLVLLIGFSRIYLGVHFMSDVIGGYATGLSGSRSVSYDLPEPSDVMGMDGWSWASLQRGHLPRPPPNDKPEPSASTEPRSLRRPASTNTNILRRRMEKNLFHRL